jgi:putative FmdB family regulatory protein
MNYEYRCTCGNTFDAQYPMGQAPDKSKCPKCGQLGGRTYAHVSWVLKGPGDSWPSQQNLRKQQMTKNNEEAGRRMRKNRDPIRPLSQPA